MYLAANAAFAASFSLKGLFLTLSIKRIPQLCRICRAAFAAYSEILFISSG